ncbi:methyltransferase domain-containing protein [Flavobacterium ovatum]|uniref:class I SAM-dependent methyltransferase n=1 Tax=Flavobacterium ovatum TaxID=1928857 RepID=UPI00344C78A4
MYQTFKNTITKIVSRKFIFKYEETLRSWYALFYTGNNYQCNVCSKKLRKFITLSNNESLCPNCGSVKRNRRLWSLLKTEFLFPQASILDFSPSRCLYRKLKKTANINYYSTDLSGDFIADHQFDITNLEIANNTLDLVICYHILEHINNDIRAIKELIRVMKPGAKALIQTPFKEGEIYEDYTFVSNEDRLKHFGQEDHVRIYSVVGLKERLQSCGFLVEIRENFSVDNKYCYDRNEKIIVITKPLN